MSISQQVWDSATKEVVNRLLPTSNYSIALSVAEKVSNGALYLVGGKLYRLLAEILYGGDFGSANADWDFLSLDTNNNPGFTIPFWNTIRGPGITQTSKFFNTNGSIAKIGQNLTLNRSWRFEYNGPSKFHIDVIAIEDIKTGGTLVDYLDSVPLSIQSIGLQIKNPIHPNLNNFVWGNSGSLALRDKIIHWNNKNRLRPIPSQSPDAYFDSKLVSMPGFMDGRKPAPLPTLTPPNSIGVSNPKYAINTPGRFINPYKVESIKKECICSSFDLFSKGCKCGAVIPYDSNAIMDKKFS